MEPVWLKPSGSPSMCRDAGECNSSTGERWRSWTVRRCKSESRVYRDRYGVER